MAGLFFFRTWTKPKLRIAHVQKLGERPLLISYYIVATIRDRVATLRDVLSVRTTTTVLILIWDGRITIPIPRTVE